MVVIVGSQGPAAVHITSQMLASAVPICRSSGLFSCRDPSNGHAPRHQLLFLTWSRCFVRERHSLRTRQFHAHLYGAEERRETVLPSSPMLGTGLRHQSKLRARAVITAPEDLHSGTPRTLVHRKAFNVDTRCVCSVSVSTCRRPLSPWL